MQQALTLYRTAIGKKVVMALSGVVLFGFVIGHMLGNLQIYLGAEKLDAYSAGLKGIPVLLWGTRILLLLAVTAHIASAFQLSARNAEARAIPYRQRKDVATSYAALTMVWSGPILLFFIVYHLLHLTFGVSPDAFAPERVYNNVVFGFSHWWISTIYIVGQLALGLHLYHGGWAMFRSLGISHPRYDAAIMRAAIGLALVVTIANISIPVSVMAGFLRPEPAPIAAR